MTLSCCPHLSARCLRWLVRSGDFVNNGYSVATFKAIPLAYNLLVAIAPSDVPAPEDLPSYSGSVRRPGLQLIDALPHPLVIDNHALTRAFSLSLVTGAISVLVPCNCLQYVLPNAPSFFNANITVNGSSLYIQGAQIYGVPERLNWLGGDLFQVCAASCTATLLCFVIVSILLVCWHLLFFPPPLFPHRSLAFPTRRASWTRVVPLTTSCSFIASPTTPLLRSNCRDLAPTPLPVGRSSKNHFG